MIELISLDPVIVVVSSQGHHFNSVFICLLFSVVFLALEVSGSQHLQFGAGTFQGHLRANNILFGSLEKGPATLRVYLFHSLDIGDLIKTVGGFLDLTCHIIDQVDVSIFGQNVELAALVDLLVVDMDLTSGGVFGSGLADHGLVHSIEGHQGHFVSQGDIIERQGFYLFIIGNFQGFSKVGALVFLEGANSDICSEEHVGFEERHHGARSEFHDILSGGEFLQIL